MELSQLECFERNLRAMTHDLLTLQSAMREATTIDQRNALAYELCEEIVVAQKCVASMQATVGKGSEAHTCLASVIDALEKLGREPMSVFDMGDHLINAPCATA